MLSTSGEFVEVLNFREDNEESSEETTGCKASVYAEFDECTRSENFIEILRFRHFARYMSFTPTGKQSKKNRKDACFQNFWKMSVLFLFKGKGENKKWQRRKKCVHQRITSRVQMLHKANPDMEETAIPVELVTCSGSGLDQHISPLKR